jgi:hypothetical protein
MRSKSDRTPWGGYLSRKTSGSYLLTVYLPFFLIFLAKHYGRERPPRIASYQMGRRLAPNPLGNLLHRHTDLQATQETQGY